MIITKIEEVCSLENIIVTLAIISVISIIILVIIGLVGFGAAGYYLAELALRWDVESVCWFVHKQITGLGSQCYAHIYLLLLSHRQCPEVYL